MGVNTAFVDQREGGQSHGDSLHVVDQLRLTRELTKPAASRDEVPSFSIM